MRQVSAVAGGKEAQVTSRARRAESQANSPETKLFVARQKELTFHFKEQPAIAEEQIIGVVQLEVGVELGVVVHETFREVLELGGHGNAVEQKVWFQSLHQSNKAEVSVSLLPNSDQQGAGQVRHPLTIAHTLVVEGVGGQDVEQGGDIGVALPRKEGVLPIRS